MNVELKGGPLHGTVRDVGSNINTLERASFDENGYGVLIYTKTNEKSDFGLPVFEYTKTRRDELQ